ncbi:MAG: hypothetical protein DHS20C15_32710 [Planctomycetota bacterium]|nr:MAG: hypothetical protein DHS20C15_32710 [Planctomycetota bacterium]
MLRMFLLSTTLLVALFNPLVSAQDADTSAAAEDAAVAAENAADAAQDAADAADEAAEEASDAIGLDSPGDAVDFVTKWTDKGMTWLEEDGAAFALKLLMFFVILLVFKILAGALAGLTGKALSGAKLNVSDLLKTFATTTVRKVVFFIGLIVALGTIGVDVAPFLAAAGVLGFVVGFALQDTLGNFAAGIMILLYRPYDIGQVVTAGGTTGKVTAMTLVSTTMMTPDNQKVIVPNGSIWGGTITNITAMDTRRVDMTMGIGYGDDIDKARAVIERVVTAHELVLKDPAPQIEVSNLGDSTVDFVVRPWSKTGDYWAVKFDLTKALKQEFDKEGISIPFPQRDVHLFKED